MRRIFLDRPVGVGARRALGVVALIFVVSQTGHAQAPPPSSPSDASQCFGFAFGPWNPALNWEAAGHGHTLDSARVPRAPGGRGWAATEVEAQSDTTLLLFPPWWPAGIVITYGAKPVSPKDTVPGRAVALVADGRKRPPTSSVRLWQVPCGQ
jgi:hypothetical protein